MKRQLKEAVLFEFHIQ